MDATTPITRDVIIRKRQLYFAAMVFAIDEVNIQKYLIRSSRVEDNLKKKFAFD